MSVARVLDVRACAPGLGRVVLAVDDDPVQLSLVNVILQHAGFVVETATSAAEALAKVGMIDDLHAVLSDVVMDEMDGFTFCERLRSLPELNRVPVVLMSADFRESADRALATAVGANALVRRTSDLKPAIDALVKSLSDGLSHRPTQMLAAKLHRSRMAHQIIELRRRSSSAERRYQTLIDKTAVDAAGEKMALTLRDVTERLAIAQTLEASERKYRLLIENTPDVVWSAGLDGKLTFVSANVASVIGFTADELLARLPTRFEGLHPDDITRVAAALSALVSGEKTVIDVDYRMRTRDGRWLSCHTRARRALDVNGEDCLQGTFSDVTERKLLEEQLRQAQKLEAVGQLTAGVAHDFNNILAIILAGAEFLSAAFEPGDQRRSDADDIRSAAERGAALVKQLSAFSRRQPTKVQPLDVGQVVADVESMLVRLLGKQITLSIRKEQDLGLVRADSGQLEQVLMNLVVNARDAMPNGGSLSIETSNVEVDAPWAVSEGRARDAYVALTVTDSGTGMDDATRAKIFEPFFTTKERGRGTGLGLSTSYGIVRGFGGHFDVASTPEHGAVFTIYLPRVDQVSVPAPAPVGAKSVLIVDDDDAVRAILGRILRRKGYHVVPARDAKEAIEAAATEGAVFDLIVSDVCMPGSSGLEVVAQFRKSHPRAKVIFISGALPEAQLAAQVRAGDVRFVSKPFVTADLIDAVTQTLGA